MTASPEPAASQFFHRPALAAVLANHNVLSDIPAKAGIQSPCQAQRALKRKPSPIFLKDLPT